MLMKRDASVEQFRTRLQISCQQARAIFDCPNQQPYFHGFIYPISISREEGKGPNLIAKLMGLDEMPSKPLQTNFRKEMKRSFKVLLKSNFVKDIKYDSHQWSDFFSEQKLINNSPPIVLIKPQLDPCLQPQDNLSRSKDEAKVTLPKSSKLENGSIVTRNTMSYQQISTVNSNFRHRPLTTVRATDDWEKIQAKKEKTVGKAATTANITTEKLQYRRDGIVSDGKKIDVISRNNTVLEGKVVDLASENDNVSEEYSIETADQLSTKEGTKHTDILIEDYPGDSPVRDVTLVTTDDKNNQKSIGDIHDDRILPIGSDSKCFMRWSRQKAFLLSSYSEPAGENYSTGSLYSMVESDMKHKEVLSGVWDLGWRNGFCVKGTMQVVDDIEKQLLSELIEGICA
ncbi:hypothetical protein F3Y22_tig00111954pilonHSYRG00019 [Hibiscus syriacus]|uniref:DUF3741 domain-containing protein n=1 Tax=Hibiscus syriacus TaxID=106335 RepID=A0A6A2X7R9_HIBSY|nr:hypothetical protein F3Y22_tig00111954pilonHSYRG00019 [Hibiscus syriacus]